MAEILHQELLNNGTPCWGKVWELTHYNTESETYNSSWLLTGMTRAGSLP